MELKVRLCKAVNRIFPLPVHPFNRQASGMETYAQWQYAKGLETIRHYLDITTPADMFKGKVVLDIGCGAAGKTLYYASCGVKKIYGVDVVQRYEEEAATLASEKQLSSAFKFVYGDASHLRFNDGYFDTIIMNDAMEHVDDPGAVLDECYRVLKPGGRLYINFPPFYHPFGAHLSDAIGVPWVHAFFSESTLVKTYKDMVEHLPDGKNRIEFRISTGKDGREYFSYINRMTICRFNKLLSSKGKFMVGYYKEIPLRNFLKPLACIPGLKEAFVRMVVCVLEKH